MSKILTDNHPLGQKLTKVEALLDELGVSISLTGLSVSIVDRRSGESAALVDIETNKAVDSIPALEYKLRLNTI